MFMRVKLFVSKVAYDMYSIHAHNYIGFMYVYIYLAKGIHNEECPCALSRSFKVAAMETGARQLAAMGPRWVLVKGGNRISGVDPRAEVLAAIARIISK